MIEFIFNLLYRKLKRRHKKCLNPCFDRIYFQLKQYQHYYNNEEVSILVLIEFIFNTNIRFFNEKEEMVSILVLIEFIFNNTSQKIKQVTVLTGLNPCFDRIYFQSLHSITYSQRDTLGLNPCFDRIYFQYNIDYVDVILDLVSILVLIEFIFNIIDARNSHKRPVGVSILVLIEFIFNSNDLAEIKHGINVSILVLIEFIFNKNDELKRYQHFYSLNPCFDRIYFQFHKEEFPQNENNLSQSLF